MKSRRPVRRNPPPDFSDPRIMEALRITQTQLQGDPRGLQQQSLDLLKKRGAIRADEHARGTEFLAQQPRRNPDPWWAPAWWQMVGMWRIERYLEEAGWSDNEEITRALNAVKLDHKNRSKAVRALLKKRSMPKVYRLVRSKDGSVRKVWDRTKSADAGKFSVPPEVARMLYHPGLFGKKNAETHKVPEEFLRLPWPALTSEEVPELQMLFCQWWGSTSNVVSMFEAIAKQDPVAAILLLARIQDPSLSAWQTNGGEMNTNEQNAVADARARLAALPEFMQTGIYAGYDAEALPSSLWLVREGIRRAIANAEGLAGVAATLRRSAPAFYDYSNAVITVVMNMGRPLLAYSVPEPSEAGAVWPEQAVQMYKNIARIAHPTFIRMSYQCPSVEAIMAYSHHGRSR